MKIMENKEKKNSIVVNINWTNEAEVWLEDIFNFISEDSKKIAKKWYSSNSRS